MTTNENSRDKQQWCVLRGTGSGRLYLYPSDTVDYMKLKGMMYTNHQALEFVCDVASYDDGLRMCKLANYDLNQRSKEEREANNVR